MADDVNASIRIDLDTSDAVVALRNLQAQISAFNQSVIKSNASAVAAQQGMLSTLTAQIGASRQFTTSMVNVETSVSKLGRAIDKNKLTLGEYFRYGVASSRNFGRVFGREHNAIMELATDRVQRLQTQYVALGEAQNGMTRAMAIRPLQLYNADAAIGIQRQQLFNKLLNDGSTSLVNFGKNTQWAGRQLMVGFTVPLTIFGGIAGKIFMDLERQIINFRRVYGDATTPLEETNGMIVQIQELAKEFTKYGIAVKDTVGLASEAAAAGAQGEDLIAATAQATRLSTLGMIDQQQALTATIALQSAFKLNTEELANAVNFLNAVENQTVVSLADITEAIPKVAPIIQGLGGDVQDLAVFMAALREGGVSAGEGANALKSGLASLINPTKNAREQLEKVGINIDAILQTNKGDIQGTVRAFGDALMELGKFERQQTLATVFGKFQFARMGALFENISRDASQAQRVVDLTGMSIQELGSLAEKELGAIEESVGTKFTGAMERLKLAIAPVGEAFLRIATPIIEFATKMFEKFNELSPSVKNFIVVLTAGLGVVVPTVIMLIGLFANFAGNAVKGLALMNNFFNRLRGGAGSLDYLSDQQLDAAAAAASLEGKTESLTSALNIQRAAVGQLSRAYGGYTAAARAAAGNLPQGFRGPLRGMAAGGIVGGTGNKDSEPALLTPGEFVMNKEATQRFGPVLDAMNRGNIRQLQEGSRLTQRTHLTAAVPITASEALMERITNSTKSMLSVIQKVEGVLGRSISNISKVSNLIVEMPTQFNQAMKSGIGQAEFATQFGAVGAEKYRTTAAITKQDFETLKPHLEILDREIVNASKDFAVIGDMNIDQITKKAFEKLPEESRKMLAEVEGLSTQFNNLRVSVQDLDRLTDAEKQRLAAAGISFRPGSDPNRQYITVPGMGTASTRTRQETRSAGPSYRRSPLFSAGVGMGEAIDDGARSALQASSPSKKGKKVVEDYGDGMLSGAKQGRVDAGNAGAQLGQSFALNLDNELSRQFGEQFPAGRQSGAGRVAMPRQEDAGRIRDIDQAYAMAVEEDTRRTRELSKEKKNLRQKVSRTAGKIAGAGLAADGLIFAASMMNNSVGQFAQQIMPAVFAFQGIAMMIPMMMNPVGAVIAGLAASAAAIWFFKSKADEMTKNVQKFSDSMIATQSTIDKVGEFYGTESLVQRQGEEVIREQTGAGSEDIQKAQEFIKSEIGISMQEGLGIAFQKFGASSAADQFAANLASMVLQGVVSPEQAKSIAVAMGQSLGNEEFGINVNGKLNELLGPKNENLLERPLQLAIDISEQNQKTVQELTKDFGSLATSMEDFRKWTAGDTAAAFVPVYGVINTINKATLGWDNWFGQVARSARGILNPDDFEDVEVSLKTIGSLVGNQIAQGYDNLSAAKERYKQISEEVLKIDKKDVDAKKAAKAASREAKNDIDELTQQLKEQEQAFRAMFAQGTGTARTTVLEGMRQSITQQFENDPAMKLAWDMITGQMKDVSQDVQFNINMGISSGVLNPMAVQNLMEMFANPTEATATINFLINTYGVGTTNDMILNILNMKDPEIQKEAIIDLIVNSPELNDQTLDLLDPTKELRQEAAQRSGERVDIENEVKAARERAIAARKAYDDAYATYSAGATETTVETNELRKGLAITEQAIKDQISWIEQRGQVLGLTKEEVEEEKKNNEVLNNLYANRAAYLDDLSERSETEREQIKVLNNLKAEAEAAEKSYQDTLNEGGRVSADNAERREKERLALAPLKNEYFSLTSALKAAENPVDITIDLQGLSQEELSAINGDLATFSQFPPESVKIAGVESIGSPEQLAELTDGYEGLESTKPKVVKQAIVEVLGAQGISASAAMQQLSNMGYSLEEFAKLPNSTKYAILYNLEVEAKLNLELDNINSLLDNPLLTPQAASALEAQRQRVLGQLGDIRNQLSGLFDTTEGGGDGPGTGSGSGGEKQKSWLEQLLADTKANIDLFVGNLEKGVKPLINRLRGLNIPQQIIDAIGTGEEGRKRALEILGMTDKQRKGFINQQNRAMVGQFLRGSGGLNEQVQQQQNRDKAQQRILKNREIDRDLLDKILNDEEAVNNVLAARGPELDRILNKYEQLQTVEDVIKSKVKEVRDQHEETEKILNQQIETQQEIVNSIQDQIDALEKKNEEDQWTIRGKEREKELLDRQIEALDRANEMDQRRIDTLQRQDELRNREADALSRELDELSRIEEQTRKSYQERIDALDKVAEINSFIANQQKQQLGLSQALSQGDVYAAAASAAEMRQTQTQFAQQQARAGLEQGMENAVAGLRTSGGLTREQAEERIRQIKEQSYQTSLLIRDIEDRIFQRNQDMIPLKDQQYNLDLQIRDINDQIFNRETQIYNIRKNQLGPAEDVLANLNNQKIANQKITDELINQIEALADTEKGTNNAAKRADELAQSWYEVQKAIFDANQLANDRFAKLGKRPERKAGQTDADFAKKVKEWENKRQDILNKRNTAVDAALDSGKTAMQANAEKKYAGGRVEKYGMGGKVLQFPMGGLIPYSDGGKVFGDGSRDSVRAMLTPGEFVIRKTMVDKYGIPMMSAINQGALALPKYNTSQTSPGKISNKTQNASNVLAPMYNNYSVNVSVSGTNASADEIAHKVMAKIKNMDSANIRRVNGY